MIMYSALIKTSASKGLQASNPRGFGFEPVTRTTVAAAPAWLSGRSATAAIQPAHGQTASLLVGGEYVFQAAHRDRGLSLKDALDDTRDLGEAYAPLQKGFDGDLIGGVEHCWRRPALFRGLPRQPQTGKALLVGRA